MTKTNLSVPLDREKVGHAAITVDAANGIRKQGRN